MSDTYLTFSEKFKNSPLIDAMRIESGSIKNIQNHVVICDADTGDIHEVTAVTDNPTEIKWPDVIVKGPFNRSALVHLEYTTGKANDIESVCKIRNLTPTQIANVKSAQQRHFA